MIKAIYIKDTDSYVVNLPASVSGYQIKLKNGKIINTTSSQKLELSEIEEIRSITESNIKTHYENSEGEIITIDLYDKEISKLLKNAESEEDYHGYHVDWKFTNLEEEYKFKKFEQTWTAVYRHSVQYSDPLPIETPIVKLNTGNKFITSLFSFEKDPLIYRYDRLSASHDILNKVMNELSVPFVEEGFLTNKTKSKVAWSNSSHSGIRFAKLGGDYLFSEKWDFSKFPVIQGTLDEMEKRHKEYESEIRRIVKAKYNSKFGEINKDYIKKFAAEILPKVESLSLKISRIDSKAKTSQERIGAINLSREIEEITKKTLAGE